MRPITKIYMAKEHFLDYNARSLSLCARSTDAFKKWLVIGVPFDPSLVNEKSNCSCKSQVAINMGVVIRNKLNQPNDHNLKL